MIGVLLQIGRDPFPLILIAVLQASVWLFFSYAAWFLKPWAWMFGFGAAVFSILAAFINLIGGSGGGFLGFVISVVVAAGVIYLLFTSEVRRAFGRP
jgi:hypothetical protein